MKKRVKNQGVKMVRAIGIEPTTPTVSRRNKRKRREPGFRPVALRTSRKYVIPRGFSLIPAIEWIDGVPRIFHILCEDGNKKCGKSVGLPKRRKCAA